jgi:competence/damage-inducible protein CinA-like protein
MPTAEIITIGTELLLGEIQDTNTSYLARGLRDMGVDLYRTTTIGDNEERIAQVIREALTRCQIIITTGGLGPTVDDPTRQAVARAMGVELEYRPELWEQIHSRIFHRYGRQPSPNNMRQAWIPVGSIPIENPVGTAPSFICERGESCIASLPGVPREMEYLFQNTIVPYLKLRYNLTGIIKARVLHASGVGESQIDEWIGDLEKLSNPTVGLLAHPGVCDIRIAAKASSIEDADRMIAEMENTVRERCGETIFGADSETLASVIFKKLAVQSWRLGAFECNLNGEIRSALGEAGLPPDHVLEESGSCSPENLSDRLPSIAAQLQVDVLVGASLQPGPDQQALSLAVLTPRGLEYSQRFYGGPPQYAVPWGVNSALDYLRRNL